MAENETVAKKESTLLSVTEQIERFKEFFEEIDKKNLLEVVSSGKSSIAVDFAKLSSFDPKIAVDLLDYPEEVIKAAERSIKEIELPCSGEAKNYRIRVYNLPESQKLMIRDIRSSHIGKLLVLEGIVRRKSDVRPQVVNTRFECPNCGNIISVLQLEATFKEPHRCGCGRKGNFRLLEKELVDAQSMVLEESPEMLEGGDQPKRIGVFLKEDLVSPISEKKTNPGNRVKLIGVLKDVPVVKHGTRSTSFDLHVDTNYLETIEEDFYDIKISKEDEESIITMAKDKNVYDKLIASIAPSIYGYEKVKESLLLQLMGGVQKKRSDGIISRGDMHILLVGDPGSGKSQLLKRISVIAPKGRYVSGGGVSGAGITAAVVKDEILGGWSLEAGALVLANNGICSIDEMDKMREEDTGAMHEALEQQSYHYNTEFMLADGSTQKLGEFVDELMTKNEASILKGKDCEILPLDNLPKILTTDFSTTWAVAIDRVSRHKAPDHFYKIKYSNGQTITVTPEHPIYCAAEAEIITLPAQDIKPGMMAPAPRKLKTNPAAKLAGLPYQSEDFGVHKLTEDKKQRTLHAIQKLHKLLTGEIRFVKITKVEKVPNLDQKWTYDITVEPTHNFISKNLVLHNTISVAKANIQATLMARTTVLAAANPKYGRFDQYGNIAEQINLPPALINRFDLIFTIKDLPQVEKDEKTARHILKLHQTPDINEPEISTKLLKKYISYARQKVRPVLTDAAIDEIKDFYVQLRNREVGDERAARAIPISARQLEALVRMSEASAKVRLSDKVSREDARRAIELLVYCLMQVGREKETGQIDIDRIATGIPASQREKIFLIKQILEELEEGLGKTIPVEDVARLAVERGVSKTEVDEIIEKLKRAGDVYEPRYGFLSRM